MRPLEEPPDGREVPPPDGGTQRPIESNEQRLFDDPVEEGNALIAAIPNVRSISAFHIMHYLSLQHCFSGAS